MAEARRVAREGLQRTKPFTLSRAADDGGAEGDGLTLDGHAAVFDAPTEIDSWEGHFTEVIARGAFRKTFRERTPVLQFDHGHHPLVGSIPIGRIREAVEDDIGAYVNARLHDNWLVQPVRDAIAGESITGMSFRFSVVREEWRGEDGHLVKDDEELLAILWTESEMLTRTLKELKVPELGPVVFPAYEATDVGVRSGRAVIDLAALRTNPAERKKLARALWLAETPAQSTDDDQRDSAPPEHPEPLDEPQQDAPRDEPPAPSQDAPPADAEHPSARGDAPSLEGHPSQPEPPERDLVDQARDEAMNRILAAALQEVRAGRALTLKEIA